MDEVDEETIIWAPKTLTLLMTDILQTAHSGSVLFEIQVVVKDNCSAFFNIMFNGIIGMSLIFDLQATITKLGEIGGIDGETCVDRVQQDYFLYSYDRQGFKVNLEVIPSSKDHTIDVVALEFIFGQYCIFHGSFAMSADADTKAPKDATDTDFEKDLDDSPVKGHKPNIVARSVEGSGAAARAALKSGGIALGQTIRYLGKQYTKAAVRLSIGGPINNRESKYDEEQGHDSESSSENDSSSGSDHEDDKRDSDSEVDSDDLEAISSNKGASVAGSAPVYRSVSEKTYQRRMNRALSMKKGAEGLHAGVRTITSAALYPVRWTGRKASKLAASSNGEGGALSGTKRVILDTLGGIGNAATSVAKGVTEVLSEVGAAIGDTTLHHSRTMYGDDYANNVTKHYVDAMADVGLAGYKALNVASFGLYGIVLDAVVEGTTLMVSLYDYLVGPVLLQGYVTVIQPPFTTPDRYFAVLRPWSVSFYRKASDFTRKPTKIIPTAMLDTIPKLRVRDDGFVPVEAQATTTKSTRRRPASHPSSSAALDSEMTLRSHSDHLQQEIEAIQVAQFLDDADGIDAVDVDDEFDSITGDNEYGISMEVMNSSGDISRGHKKRLDKTETSQSKGKNDMSKSSYFGALMGGNKTHIELCTIDCSSYLLYPPLSEIQVWFDELGKGCKRVETIKKRKSGAEEIAVQRRLLSLPKTSRIYFRLRRLVIAKSKDVLNKVLGEHEEADFGVDDGGDGDLNIRRQMRRLDSEFDDDVADVDIAELDLSLDSIAEAEAEHAPPLIAQHICIEPIVDGTYDIDSTRQLDHIEDAANPIACTQSPPEARLFRSVPSNADLAGHVVETDMQQLVDETGALDHSTAYLKTTAVPADNSCYQHSTPPKSSKTSIPINQSIHQAVGKLTDPLKNSILKKCRVHIVPVTYAGVRVGLEEKISEFARVGLPIWRDTHERLSYLEAQWNEILPFSSTATSSLDFVGSEYYEIGNTACINDIECSHFLVIIEAKTIYGTVLELGRGKLVISRLPSSSSSNFDPERSTCTVDIYHRRSKLLVGRIELTGFKFDL